MTSTVDDAEIVRDDPDPSADSGKRSRLNHKTVYTVGYVIAGAIALVVGIAVWSFQHKGGTDSFTPAAQAAVRMPTTSAPYTDADRKRDVAQAAATATPMPDPAVTAAPGAPGTTGDPAASPTPSLAEREADLRDAAALDSTARHLKDAGDAITGDTVVSAAGASTGSAGPATVEPTPSGSFAGSPPTPAPPAATPSSTAADAGPVSPFSWREGDTIDATIEPNVDSDRSGGELTIIVNKPAVDSDYGALVLIPTGTVILARVVGSDESSRAVAIAPTKMRIAPGGWIPFPGAALSIDGNTGVTGRVNDHKWPALIFQTLAGALSGLSGSIGNVNGGLVVSTQQRPPVVQEALGGAGQALLNGTTQQLQKAYSRPVTVSVSRATSIKIQAYADVPLWPYCDPMQQDSRECEALRYLHPR